MRQQAGHVYNFHLVLLSIEDRFSPAHSYEAMFVWITAQSLQYVTVLFVLANTIENYPSIT